MVDTIKINKKNVKMIAHRGASGLEAENTCASFVAAGNRSFWGIETDVHVTKDGKYVIIHDDDMLRVSGANLVVEDSTLEEMQAVSLYDRTEGAYRSDLKVPVLKDYISICKFYKREAVLEFKNRIKYEDIAKMVELFREMEYLDHVIFISFYWDNLVDLRKILPDHQVQFLTDKCDDELIDKMIAQKFELDAWYPCLTKEIIDKMHANGRVVNCWTVDDPEVAEKLVDLGVDYITTDILE